MAWRLQHGTSLILDRRNEELDGSKMDEKYLTIIVIVALVCVTSMVIYALSQGINGTVLATALSIFGVIIGAIAKVIYDKEKA